jgi:MFS family permease
MPYFQFLARHARLLTFGLLLTFCSSFGQTYFIALFSGELRATFDLGHGGLGAAYTAGTLASGLVVAFVGRLIDRVDLRVFTLAVVLTLATACLVMASLAAAWMLVAAFFLLRLAGQGMMTHTAVTAMARYVPEGRGKAISIAALGLPLAEAVLPITAVAAITLIGWRGSWLAGSLLLTLGLAPLVLWLLSGHAARHAAFERAGGRAAVGRSWSRREVLTDPRFHLMLPALLAPSFISTGVFFHQVRVTEVKGWELAWFASGFAAYAAASVATSLVSGPLVDRLGARHLVRHVLLPIGIASLSLALTDHPIAILLWMVGTGATSGASVTVVNALWAELYGVAHLGAIRALAQAGMVISSALSPWLFGFLFDAGVGVTTVLLACVAYLVAGTVLLHLAAAPGLARRHPS